MIKPLFTVYEDKIVYTWIGHSTAVISIGKEVNILIDPVFCQRASPTQLIGPKRFRPPACNLEDENFPNIDLVLVSHDHYDHLDEEALRTIFMKNPNALFVAGL